MQTETYRIPTSLFGRKIAMTWISRWWWCLAIPLLAAVIAGTFDWRWWIAGLAVLLVLYPAVLLFAYYYYALDPVTVRSILPQRLITDDDNFTIIYYPLIEGGNAPPPLTFLRADIASCRLDADFLSLKLTDGTSLYLPRNAFPRGLIYEIFPELTQQL